MRRQFLLTADGSPTLYLPDWNETYHSRHGAIAEAYHVFIKNGFALLAPAQQPLSILEMGFGTGLNTFITCLEAEKYQCPVYYEAVEAYPLSPSEAISLNYPGYLYPSPQNSLFTAMHQLSWEEEHPLSGYVTFKKRQQLFSDIRDTARFNLIYFDAFSPRVQPELWEELIFRNMYASLQPGGILVTYCAKGAVRRTLQEVGFMVERLPGPPGKREMLRARKDITGG